MKLLCFVLYCLCIAPVALGNNYGTPGTGVRWNLDDMVTNAGGDVTFSAGKYHVNDTVFIRSSDTLYITSDAIVDFAVNAYLDVNGTLIIDPPAAVVFTAQDVTAGFYGVRIDSSNSTILRKLTLEYAVSLRLNDCNIVVDRCTFRYNSPTTNFGNGAISLFRASPLITNCQFLDNQRAAIQGGANISNAPKIIGCLFRGNNTLNTNVPQINLGATGDGSDTVQIINNQILRASVNSGGLGFLPIGNVYAVIRGNIIKNNRYGMTFNGGSNINAWIGYNQVDSNNIQGDASLGGSGIAFAGGTASSQQNSIVTGNLFRWNLWGITIQGRSRPNLGNVSNEDTADDGKNRFIDNTNAATPGIDLYNNSPDLIFAQNNYWGTDDINVIETKIFHQADNGALGLVNYSNFMLPVKLNGFTAAAKGNGVSLNWQTASETNTDVFIVERSGDGRVFVPIATLAASGFTASVRAYSFFDDQVSGINSRVFYRLKMVDRDSRFVYSPVTAVRWNNGLAQPVNLYPTSIAAFQPLQVSVRSTKKQTVYITFSDASGRTLAQDAKPLTAGDNQFVCFPTAVLPKGLIYVRFTGDGIEQTIPLFYR